MNMVTLEEVRQTLQIPGKVKPIADSSVRSLLRKLRVKTVLDKNKSDNYLRSYISAADGESVKEEFKRIHWKHFR